MLACAVTLGGRMGVGVGGADYTLVASLLVLTSAGGGR